MIRRCKIHSVVKVKLVTVLNTMQRRLIQGMEVKHHTSFTHCQII